MRARWERLGPRVVVGQAGVVRTVGRVAPQRHRGPDCSTYGRRVVATSLKNLSPKLWSQIPATAMAFDSGAWAGSDLRDEANLPDVEL